MSGDGEGTCFKVWKKARTTVLVHKSPKLQMIDDPKAVRRGARRGPFVL